MPICKLFFSVREWSSNMWKILQEAVPAIWEANGRMGKIPNTTLFASGNLTIEEVEKRLSGPIRSKLTVIFTGEKSMNHERLSEICEEIVDAAKQLYKYLPSVIGLGCKTMLQKVSTDVVRSYAGELRVPDDQRESQVLFEYDSLFKVLLETGINFNLELPALFSKSFIDHGCVTGN